MAHKNVVTAVMTVVEDPDTWDHANIPIKKINDNEELPMEGGPFVMFQFPVSRTTRISLGERHYEEIGTLRIVLSVPRGRGLDVVSTQGDQLASLFRDVEYGGVRFRVPESPIMDDTNDEGSYFVAIIIVPYSYQFTDN